MSQRRNTKAPKGINPVFLSRKRPEMIIKRILNFHEKKMSDLQLKDRHSELVWVRHELGYFLSFNKNISWVDISHITGHANHASVIHSRNLIEDLIETTPAFRNDIVSKFALLRY